MARACSELSESCSVSAWQKPEHHSNNTSIGGVGVKEPAINNMQDSQLKITHTKPAEDQAPPLQEKHTHAMHSLYSEHPAQRPFNTATSRGEDRRHQKKSCAHTHVLFLCREKAFGWTGRPFRACTEAVHTHLQSQLDHLLLNLVVIQNAVARQLVEDGQETEGRGGVGGKPRGGIAGLRPQAPSISSQTAAGQLLKGLAQVLHDGLSTDVAVDTP